MTTENVMQVIDSTGPPYLHVIEANISDLTDFGMSLALEGQQPTAVRWVRGLKMRTLDRVFDELAAALQFPYYFGENYAALYDCLGDLSWLPAAQYLLIVSNSSSVLQEEPVEFPAFVRTLQGAAEGWGRPVAQGEIWDRPALPFHIFFHSETRPEAKEIQKKLTEAGSVFDVIEYVSRRK